MAGSFTLYNGLGRSHLARLFDDGSVDATLDPGSGPNQSVYALRVQPDGKLLLGGAFTSYSGISRPFLARANANGVLDLSFTIGSGANAGVRAIELQADGRILIGGSFTLYAGHTRNRVARLLPDGSLDLSYLLGAGADGPVLAMALQEDGKALVGGAFTAFDGQVCHRVARLNLDGSLDPSFAGAAGGSVYTIARTPEGKLLIGGIFSSYAGVARSNIARLHPDGSLDASFDPGTGANSSIYAVALQADGKILVGGDFTSFNGVSRHKLARLNHDGSVDMSFQPGAGPNFAVRALAMQQDEKLLLAGDFMTVDGMPRAHVARVHALSAFVGFCFGDGVLGNGCPCNNLGIVGRGCNNSLGTGGGWLRCAGVPSSDTVVFTASELLPSSLTIFLQGSASLSPPAVFGDGLRCTAGTLKRLYHRLAQGGVAMAPTAAEIPVRLRSASLGDPIAPGSTRHYQAYYRDPDPTFCTAPAGGSFNVTNGVSIVWP